MFQLTSTWTCRSVGEQREEPGLLLGGEQVDAGVQGPPAGVERVTGVAAVPAGVLLDPAPALVEGVAGKADDVERVHHRDRVGQLLGGGGLEAGEAVHRHDLDLVAPGLRAVGEPGLERLLGTAFDHVQQPGRAGAVADPGQVDDDGDELVAACGCAARRARRHRSRATPSNRLGSAIRTRWPSARTASLAVFQATPRASATRATVRCWQTIPFSAHRSASAGELGPRLARPG